MRFDADSDDAAEEMIIQVHFTLRTSLNLCPKRAWQCCYVLNTQLYSILANDVMMNSPHVRNLAPPIPYCCRLAPKPLQEDSDEGDSVDIYQGEQHITEQ